MTLMMIYPLYKFHSLPIMGLIRDLIAITQVSMSSFHLLRYHRLPLVSVMIPYPGMTCWQPQKAWLVTLLIWGMFVTLAMTGMGHWHLSLGPLLKGTTGCLNMKRTHIFHHWMYCTCLQYYDANTMSEANGKYHIQITYFFLTFAFCQF